MAGDVQRMAQGIAEEIESGSESYARHQRGYTSPELHRILPDEDLYITRSGNVITEDEETESDPIIGTATVKFIVSGNDSYRVVDFDIDYLEQEIP